MNKLAILAATAMVAATPVMGRDWKTEITPPSFETEVKPSLPPFKTTVKKAKPSSAAGVKLSAEEIETLRQEYTSTMLGHWSDYQHQAEVNANTPEAQTARLDNQQFALAIFMALEQDFSTESELTNRIKGNVAVMKSGTMPREFYEAIMRAYGGIGALYKEKPPLIISPEEGR